MGLKRLEDIAQNIRPTIKLRTFGPPGPDSSAVCLGDRVELATKQQGTVVNVYYIVVSGRSMFRVTLEDYKDELWPLAGIASGQIAGMCVHIRLDGESDSLLSCEFDGVHYCEGIFKLLERAGHNGEKK